MLDLVPELVIDYRISRRKLLTTYTKSHFKFVFKQSIFEEKLRRRMQEALGSASKFFKQIFTKKTLLKDEFKMGFGIRHR